MMLPIGKAARKFIVHYLGNGGTITKAKYLDGEHMLNEESREITFWLDEMTEITKDVDELMRWWGIKMEKKVLEAI